jgi:hypothetical protein
MEPNNMTTNGTFLEVDLVPNILKALRKFLNSAFSFI